MRALLDVNVLLALFDPGHIHYQTAHAWWKGQEHNGWASCALTQNGFIRIASNPSYPRPLALADAVAILRAQISLPGHEFWPDDISLTDSETFDTTRILGPSQITDAYLLGLAVKNDGVLTTLDRGIPTSAVLGAEQRHILVLRP